jgi:hypothetical protein
MIHHITLYSVRPQADAARLDGMIIAARVSLFRVPGVQSVRCGKSADLENPWTFFVAIECESMERLRFIKEDAHYIKFIADNITPHIVQAQSYSFEMEVGRDVKYS